MKENKDMRKSVLLVKVKGKPFIMIMVVDTSPSESSEEITH